MPKNVWETVWAFSNCSDGWIVLVVTQKRKEFEITGIDNPEKFEQDFFGTLRSKKFNVPLFAKAERFEIDGNKVIAFHIPSSEVKPVYIVSPGNTYIRTSRSRPIGSEEAKFGSLMPTHMIKIQSDH